MTRRFLIVAAVCLATAASAAAARTQPASRSPQAVERATRAWLALEQRFRTPAGTYADAGKSHAHAWPFSQAFAASVLLGSPADTRRIVRILEHYRRGEAYDSVPGGGTQFFDDNEWIALDLVAAHGLLGDPALLRRAEALFRYVTAGWDADGRNPCSGGVFWANTPKIRDRNTVSTANGALLALELYRTTSKRSYLAWAQRMVGWVERCLRAPDGLYWDHLDRNGRIFKDKWTYNQGAMVAAQVLLAGATHQRAYLDSAERLAHRALAHYRQTGFRGEPPIFVAIFFRDLRLLERARPCAGCRRALHEYVRVHAQPRADGSFGRTLLDQSAAAQLYALSLD